MEGIPYRSGRSGRKVHEKNSVQDFIGYIFGHDIADWQHNANRASKHIRYDDESLSLPANMSW